MNSDFYEFIQVRGILNNEGKNKQETAETHFILCNLNDFTGYVNVCMQR